MDMVFLLEEETRSAFIRSVVQTLGLKYICLWSCQPYLPKCLVCVDGWYEEDEPATEARLLRQKLFHAYRGSICVIENGGIPGLAYKEGKPYLRLAQASLQSMARKETQRQFYQGAGIKTAVFLACGSGEIEIGASSSNINLEVEDIRNLFTGDMIMQFQSVNPVHPQERSRASSSSSSLRSFSVGSPEHSSVLMNLSIPPSFQESMRSQTSLPSTINHPHPYALPSSIHMDDVAITKAMLAVISSSASSLSSPSTSSQLSTQTGAFKRYTHTMSPSRFIRKSSLRSQSLLKLSVIILRAINQQRIEAEMRESRPAASQLSHVISERKRREKLNESFQALRALLPPGTRKDKASVLSSTKEYMTALKAQIAELEGRNRALEAQIPLLPTSKDEPRGKEEESSGGEGREVRVVEISSAIEDREIELTVRKQMDLMDLVLRLLGCIKGMNNVVLLAMASDVQRVQHQSSVVLKLKVKGSDWSKPNFEEMISRVVDG